jgi:amidase
MYGETNLLTQCQAYIARILEVNSTLHMVTEINPDALQIAKDLDEERACGKLRGYVAGCISSRAAV